MGSDVQTLITEHIDLWTSAIQKKKSVGRGSSKKHNLYGIKKLRELILELAVRGKLVPQDPSDEPGSVLLERITEERDRLVKEKKIKKPKKIPQISEEEVFFDLPDSWAWARLGDFTNYGVTDKAEAGDMVPSSWVLELEDVEKETSRLLKKVRFVDREFRSSKNRFMPGDVLYGKLRPYLDKVLVADEEGVCTTEMIPFRAYGFFEPRFLRLLMKAPFFIEYANNSTHGMNLPRLGTDKARLAILPIASRNEQVRIVHRVDELMALCDQLEAQTENNITAHQQLVEILLGTLTQSPNADELAENWQRLAEHFDTLFTTEHSIDQLKQTILQLAVMGKLVTQDPNDEPASVLLERIAAEKEQLIKDKKIKKQKALPLISESEKYLVKPKGWEWVRLDQLFNIIVDCPHSTAKFIDNGKLCLDTNSFKQGILLEHKFRFVSEETYLHRNKRLTPAPRDIVFAREGSVGESVVIPEGIECCLGQRVMLFRPSEQLNAEYLRLSISSPLTLQALLSMHKGIGAKHVNVRDMKHYLICLPSIAEQQRIVSKLNELTTFCNQLKARLQESQQTELYMSDALIKQALK